MNRFRLYSSLTTALLAVPFVVQAEDPVNCAELSMFGTRVVITTDFEGIATESGNDGAVPLVGDEFYGFEMAADSGGLWVGIPDSTLGSDNCENFFANDFVAVSGEAVFSPGNCEYPGSPIGTVIVNFDVPVSALGLSFLDAEGAASSVTAYDGDGNMLGSSVAQGLADNGQAFRYVASSDPDFPIASAVIQLGGGGDGVGMDDLCFVDPDSDGDGVSNSADLCPGTMETDPNVPTTGQLGVNRWIWEGWDWVTNARGVVKDFTIEQTQGCSCEQILDTLVEKTDRDFEGHYKFGCSQSVVEDWIAGLYYMETVEVQAASAVPVDSLTVLKSSVNYQLMAYGVADAQSLLGQPPIPFDAKYSVTTEAGEDPDWPPDWTDSVTGYLAFGPQLLDLHVNDAFIDWGSFNTEHTYWYEMAGTDAPVSLKIYDIYPDNNEGFLSVDIFVDLW